MIRHIKLDLIKSKYEKKEDLKMNDKIYIFNSNINKYSYLFIFIKNLSPDKKFCIYKKGTNLAVVTIS